MLLLKRREIRQLDENALMQHCSSRHSRDPSTSPSFLRHSVLLRMTAQRVESRIHQYEKWIDMQTKFFISQTTALLFLLLLNGSAISAQKQMAPVPDNQQAIELAQKSPMVQLAYRYLLARAAKIGDERLRKETRDAIGNAQTCIRHRAGLSVEDKKRIAEILIASGLADAKDDATFPGGLERGM